MSEPLSSGGHVQQSKSPQVCEVCGAKAPTLRRGRCWICYMRWAETRPAGAGATCVVCGERRRENLRLVEFRNSWVPMCHNCGTKMLRLSPMPQTIDGIRQNLARDRRWKIRRGEKFDQRLRPLERRMWDRRSKAAEAAAAGEWLDAEDLIIEILDPDPAEESGDAGEVTRIAPARYFAEKQDSDAKTDSML